MALTCAERQRRYRERKRNGEVDPIKQRKNKDSRERMRAWREKHPTLERERKWSIKRQVLTHYGGGKCACFQCGFGDIRALSIDHIDGRGSQHRKEKGVGSGGSFYRWLVKNDLPGGYQTLCMNCQFVKREERWEYNEHNKKPVTCVTF